MDVSYLQFLLYVLGAVLLGALIILVIKLVYSISRINMILDSLEKKLRTVDKAFGAVDRIVDAFSLATDKVVEGISNSISKVFNHKKKKSKIKEEVEEDE